LMTGNFVMRMRRGKEVEGGQRASKRERERETKAVGYENFSDVASPRFMIFHRTAAESGE